MSCVQNEAIAISCNMVIQGEVWSPCTGSRIHNVSPTCSSYIKFTTFPPLLASSQTDRSDR